MNSKQTYFLLVGILTLLTIGMVGGVYGLNGLLEKQSNDVVSQKTKLASLDQEQTQLAQLKKDIAVNNQLYTIARSIVPQSKDQTETVRQIVNLAQTSGINLAAIRFPSSAIGSGSSGLGTSTTPGTTSSGTAVVAAPGTSSNPALSQLIAIPNIPGVYDLAIEVDSSTDTGKLATYPQLISFLSSLEQNRLTAQVSSMNILPSPSNHNLLSFSLNLDIYIKP